MAFEWITGKRRDYRLGSEGDIAILCDVSGTMTKHNLTLRKAFKRIKGQYPGARVFVFSDDCFEVTCLDDDIPGLGGGTNMTWGIEFAAMKMSPAKTLIIGDGYDSSGQPRKAAEKLTGAIETLWCFEERDVSGANGPMSRKMAMDARQLMIDLARNGQMRPFCFDRDDLSKEVERSLFPKTKETAMSRKQLPDHMLEDGDEFEFQRPDDVEVDLRQHITIVRGTVFTEKHVAPEWRKEGQAVSQRVMTPGAQISVQAPQNLISRTFSWLTGPAPQAEQNRGALQPAPIDVEYLPVQQPVGGYLPAPQSQPTPQGVLPAPGRFALPAPAQPAGQPPQFRAPVKFRGQ